MEKGVININRGDVEDYKMSGEEVKYHIIGVLLAQQFSLKAVLKKFGKPGEKSSVEEQTQIHDMTIFRTLDPKKLTRKDRIKSLSSLMFLLGKQDGTIKARTCTDGGKQIRDDIHNKHYCASSNCANNIVMITSALEAKKFREVRIINILGAYIHTYMDKHGKQRIIIIFKGKLEELVVMVYPKLYQ